VNHPTEHYIKLEKHIAHARTIVRGVDLHECKTDLQHLKLQSYILLTHAVIEQYVEDLCLEIAKEARSRFSKKNVITQALVGLIAAQVLSEKSSGRASKKIGSELVRNLDDFSKEAFNKFNEVVKSNHGIKAENLKSLFHPIGIDPIDVDLALVNALESFGTTRGGIAHKFAIKRENTLSDVESGLKAMIRDLAALDKEAVAVLESSLIDASAAD
tara:strand:+ start:1695 stop:2339 length:645 start_codon:yes stop_codon:yes gene_type:complete